MGNNHFRKNAFRDIFMFLMLNGGDFSKHWGKENTQDAFTCSRICGSVELDTLFENFPKGRVASWPNGFNQLLSLQGIEDLLLKFQCEIQYEILPLETFCSVSRADLSVNWKDSNLLVWAPVF